MNNDDTQQKVAELVRISAKHLYWASNNLAKVYELVKPADVQEFIEFDPMQTRLFDDLNEIQTNEDRSN